MQRILILSLLIFGMVGLSQKAASKCTLRMRVNDLPPQYENVDGHWRGIAVREMTALLKEAGCTPVFVKEPWKRALADLRSGLIDGVANVNYTERRAQYFRYLWLGHVEKTVLVVKKSLVGQAQTLDQVLKLPGRISYEDGDRFGPPLEDVISHDKAFDKKLFVLTRGNQYNLLTYGRVVGLLDMQENAEYQLAQDPELARKFVVAPAHLSSIPDFLAISRKSVDLKTFLQLQEANIRLTSGGVYKQIYQEWMSDSGK